MDSLRINMKQRTGRRWARPVAIAVTLLSATVFALPASAGGYGKKGHKKKEVKIIERVIERERIVERDREIDDQQTRGIERIERRRRKTLRFSQTLCGCPRDPGYKTGYATGVASVGGKGHYGRVAVSTHHYSAPVVVAPREVHVMPRFSSSYSAPAYLADSRAPTIVYHSPYEDHYEGSVIGALEVRSAGHHKARRTAVIAVPTVVHRVRRSYGHGYHGHHYGFGAHHW